MHQFEVSLVIPDYGYKLPVQIGFSAIELDKEGRVFDLGRLERILKAWSASQAQKQEKFVSSASELVYSVWLHIMGHIKVHEQHTSADADYRVVCTFVECEPIPGQRHRYVYAP